MTRRWGKAGQRLTDEEIRARDGAGRKRAIRRDARRRSDDAAAHQAWAEGRVIPASITAALDAHALYGPEVDKACGAREPDVDRWEAGDLYPTWEQVCLLADLCLVRPSFFVHSHGQLDPRTTSLRFHLPSGSDPLPPPVLFFRAEVVEATMKRLGRA